MRLRLDRRFLAVLALAAAGIAMIAAIGVLSTAHWREALAQAQRAAQAREALADLQSALEGADEALRSHVLDGDTSAAAAYRDADARAAARLDAAERLAEPDADLLDLRAAVDVKRDQLATTMALALQDRAGAAARITGDDRNRSLERVRALLRRLDDAAGARVVRRLDQAQRELQRDRSLLLVAGAAGIALFTVLGGRLRSQRAARLRALGLQRRHRQALEWLMAERTRALQATRDALALSETRLRAIFETASEAIVTVDARQRIVMANMAAASMFGHRVERLIGAPLDLLIPAPLQQWHHEAVATFVGGASGRRTMGGGGPLIGQRSSGERFSAEATISQQRVNGQDFCTAVIRDTSEQRRAEQEVRDSEARIRRLLELLPDAVLVQADEGIAYVNAEALHLFGGTPAQLAARTPLALVHPDSRALLQQRMEALQAGVTTLPLVELRVMRLDGGIRTVQATATQFIERGHPQIVLVMRDVSELRRIEADLARSNADLQRLVAAQDEVQEGERRRIAIELHDELQQTLAAIKMDIGLAVQRLADTAPATLALLQSARELADQSIEATRRIIGDLRPQMLDDLGLVAALRTLAAQFSRRTGMACHVEADAHAVEPLLPPRAATCLYRIVQEALNNVAKHSGARTAQVTLEVQPRQLRLVIRDDGVGIAAMQQRRSGAVGLIGMQERVRMIDGTLDVRPGDDGGTLVCVSVPRPVRLPDAAFAARAPASIDR
ncbi:PAS domain-containing sensor histidine kinase [Aquabacterium humicola]|uniref:PAS domain-containing sensor histidine kinase n=1 Tax=Aquabacterium humicola TaxID=3237377 RepID=UPI0025437B3F|nr:PAS domain-containing sensor histidine kinase [Rubrivivax pictus]